MRILLSLLLSTFMCAKAQHIPAFANDSAAYAKMPAGIIKKFSKQYDAIISYATKCSFPKQEHYFILGFRNNKWELQRASISTVGRYTDNDTITINKPKRVSQRRINKILSFWELKHFWLMNNDSLNWRSKILEDGRTTMLISDGCSDDFEIFSNGKYKLVYSYMADAYQKDIPIKQREEFILCRNYFFKVMKIRN